MIEIVYKEDKPEVEQNIKLPKNVKQIGAEQGKRKVYIEDYVISFIKEGATKRNAGYGVLLGDIKRSGGDTYVFVNGAVEAKSEEDEKKYIFDDNIWTSIYEKIKTYFDECDIVGWYIKTGDNLYGQATSHERMVNLEKIHLDNFAGSDRICFYYDSVENEEVIYAYDSGMLRRYYGYYVYYDKNQCMRNYMDSLIENFVGYKKDDSAKELNAARSIGGMYAKEGELRKQQAGAKAKKSSKKTNIFGKGGYTKYVAGVTAIVLAAAWFGKVGQMDKVKDSMRHIAEEFSQDKNVESKEQYDDYDGVNIREVNGEVYPTSESEEEQTTNQETTVQQTETVLQETDGSQNTTASIEADTNFYIVEKGESLSSICKKIYGNMNRKKEIMKINNISDENKIYEGQKIKLPS